MPNFDISQYVNMAPVELRRLVRSGKVKSIPTAGMCAGYAQANLVILPREYAEDFKEFARLNPGPCPILEVLDGDPHTHDMGEDGNILTDIPEYFIYRDGKGGLPHRLQLLLRGGADEGRHRGPPHRHGPERAHVQDQRHDQTGRSLLGAHGLLHAAHDPGGRQTGL